MDDAIKMKMNIHSILMGKTIFYMNESIVDKNSPRHTHDFFEIDFITEGTCQSVIDEEEYTLEKKMVVIMPPMHYHDYSVREGDRIDIMNFAFFVSSLQAQASKNVPYLNPIVFSLSDSEFECIAAMCRTVLKKRAENSLQYEYFVKTCIEWILMLMEKKEISVLSNKNRDIDFSNVLQYIHSNFSDPELNRDGVAKIMNYSPSYFSKCFHKAVGIPFQEYLLSYRLSCACELLKTSNKTATEVAGIVGFSSYGYFVKRYKQKYGILPSDTKGK